MYQQPQVSIVITAYNDATTVAQAIESALAQQSAAVKEVIVVLDGPNDDTPAIVERFRPQLTQVIHKENGGTASARNAGLQAASGEWIQFLDADDILLESKVSASLSALGRDGDRDNLALIYTGYHRIDSEGRVFSTDYAEPFERQRLLGQSGHITPNPLVRRSAIIDAGGYCDDYRYAEDTEAYLRMGLVWRMLAVKEPHFLYRVSARQKTQTMRGPASSNLVHIEPEQMRKAYREPYREQGPEWTHPIGAFSQRGVLEVGLKCTHSCKFCYYSFLDGSDDQFRGMRRASLRSVAECKAILDHMAAGGLTHYDITGGEPTIHPGLVEIVRYGWQTHGLRARLITLGQFLMRPFNRKRSQPLIDELLEAGLEDFLFSVHAVDPQLFFETTGERFERLEAAMSELDSRDLSYGTNTLIYQGNYRSLPEIARKLTAHRVRIANLIVMNTYFRWNEGERGPLGVQARYREIYPFLLAAVRELDQAGIAVNIRYGPLCAYGGMERHYVGVLGVELDPYEWRTTLRTGQIKAHCDVASYLAQQRAALADSESMFTKSYGRKCEGCRMRLICDGVDSKYVAQYGFDEFQPYGRSYGEPEVSDPMHFRRDNPASFLQRAGGVSEAQRQRSRAMRARNKGEAYDSEVSELLGLGDIPAAAAWLERRLEQPAAQPLHFFQLAKLLKLLDRRERIDALGPVLEGQQDVSAASVLRWRMLHGIGLVPGQQTMRDLLRGSSFGL